MYFEERPSELTVRPWKNCDFPIHLHRNIEILICTEGELIATCNNKTKVLTPGWASISFPHDTHSYSDSTHGRGVMIFFNPEISDIITKRLSEHKYENFGYDSQLTQLANEAYKSWLNNECYDITFGYLHIIFGKIISKLSESDFRSELQSDLFNNALKHISGNFTDTITLKGVAKFCGVDQAHLSRIFSKKIPGGFHSYLQQLRIENAKRLLTHSDNTIYDIMLQSGFSSQRTFNRIFKEFTGITPQEYRLKQKLAK